MTLIERLQQADGPSRELDAEIAPLTGLRIVDEGHPIGRVCYDANGHGVPLPAYTASLDAAMMLRPEGCLFMARTVWDDADNPTERPVGYASIDRYFRDDGGLMWKQNFRALAATPALALCIAALSAQEASNG